MKNFVTLTFALFLFQNVYSQPVDNTYFPSHMEVVTKLPARKNVWIFLLAGQSNMAGRGLVEAADTLPDPRILSVNQKNQVIVAKEPLHYYEPTRTGLDCGISFARTLLKSVPPNITILLVPAAVGGSSVQQWLGDSAYRSVKLLTNAKTKLEAAKNFGIVKGVLWHQGETNAMENIDVERHAENVAKLAAVFRAIAGDAKLPFLVAELGSFSNYKDAFDKINVQLRDFSGSDPASAFIETTDLQHKGDSLHFDSPSQRKMGERFANAYASRFLRKNKRRAR